MRHELILASTSPYRRALLDRLGLPYRALPPAFTERTEAEVPDPEAMVVENARGKTAGLAAMHPGAIVIGCDQTAVCEGEVLGKPETEARAVEQLLRLAGREHALLTAVSVRRSAEERTTLVRSVLRMRPFSREEAAAYVTRERPIDCAGAYKSEGLGIALFDAMGGEDPTAIVGLPLIALIRLLRDFGLNVLLPEGDREP